MTDESLLEWASEYVPDSPRFLDGLAAELKKRRDMMGSALTVIESFRPLVNAARAFLEYPARPHECPGFDCATCAPRGEVERSLENIADMVADADAEAGKKP